MTFLIFDPQNDLIFVHLEPSFEQFLLDSDLISLAGDVNNNSNHFTDSQTNSIRLNSQSPDDGPGPNNAGARSGENSTVTSNENSVNTDNFADLDHETALKFSITLLLAPFVSTKRQMDDEASQCDLNGHDTPISDSVNIRFDSIPNTYITYHNCHQFMFIHLCQKVTNTPFSPGNSLDSLQSIYLQRKISMFVQLTFFVFGNALYNMSKHSRELKLLLELVNKWTEMNEEFCFLFECLESLSLGSHLKAEIGRNMNHVEQLIRLYAQSSMNERCTGLLLLFHDKLIFKHLTHSTTLRQEDILSIFLLSQLESPLHDSVTESDEYRNPLYHGNGHLIFLKSHSLSIPVPHIYRKLMITEELYLLTIAEVTAPISSILLLSLSTMIESFASLKRELHDHHRFSPRKWTESLKRIVENFQRFIRRNFEPSLFLSQHLNIGSMTQLTELTKNSHNLESNTLAREQMDRILTLTIRTLYYYYERLAFSHLHTELLPQCLQSFQQAQKEISHYLSRTFQNSVDFIRVKYGTERVSLGTLFQQNFDLLAFVLIDRKANHFVFGHSPEVSVKFVVDNVCEVYRQLDNRRFMVVDRKVNRCLYLHHSLMQNKPVKPEVSLTGKTCELSRILSDESSLHFHSPSFISTSSTAFFQTSPSLQYELFAMTRIQTFTLLSPMIPTIPDEEETDNELDKRIDNSIANGMEDESNSLKVCLVEPCEPSLKEAIYLSKKIVEYLTNG